MTTDGVGGWGGGGRDGEGENRGEKQRLGERVRGVSVREKER